MKKKALLSSHSIWAWLCWIIWKYVYSPSSNHFLFGLSSLQHLQLDLCFTSKMVVSLHIAKISNFLSSDLLLNLLIPKLIKFQLHQLKLSLANAIEHRISSHIPNQCHTKAKKKALSWPMIQTSCGENHQFTLKFS